MKSYFLLFGLSIFVFSCNIFSWTWSDDEDSYIYNEEMYIKYIQENDFDSAIYYADRIIESDSTLYQGHYYRAKAIRYKLMGNKFSLIQELLKYDSTAVEYSMPLSGLSLTRMDSIFRAVIEINKSLDYIIDNNLAPSDRLGTLRIDLMLSYMIYGILAIQDLNGNGLISDDSKYAKIIDLSYDDGIIKMKGLDSLYKVMGNDPHYINDAIDNVSQIFTKSSNLLSTIVDTSFFSTSDLVDMTKDIPSEIVKYKIGDKIDNDRDSDDFLDKNGNNLPDIGEPGVDSLGFVYQDGLDNDLDGIVDENIDEETVNGIDDDGDGLIDEDGTNVTLVIGEQQ